MPESEKYNVIVYSREHGLMGSLATYEETVFESEILE